MYKLTKREWDTLLFLLEQEKPVAVSAIAGQFQISPRTLQGDLGNIQAFLTELDIALERRAGVGVWIDNKFGAIQKLGGKMQYMDNSMYRVFSGRERVEKILGILFVADDYIVLQELSDSMYIHRSTLSKTLEEAGNWLRERSIEIEKKPGRGIRLKADERTYRTVWQEYIRSTFSMETIYNIILASYVPSRIERYEHLQMLTEAARAGEILAAIGRLSERTGIEFSDETICELSLYLLIACHRVQIGYTVSATASQMEAIRQSSIFGAVESLMEEICPEGIAFGEGEVCFATIKFLVSRVKRLDESKNTRVPTKEERQVAHTYIRRVSEKTNIKLNQDPLLYKNMLLHIHTTMAHVRYAIPISNSVAAQVMREYPEYFRIVEQVTREIHSIIPYPDSSDEVAYITMHILGAIERLHKNRRNETIRILVACVAALGTSQLLRARLEAEFEGIEIIGEISVSKVYQYAADADLIVTTLPLRDTLLIPVITVNPLLPTADRVKIRDALDELRGRPVAAPKSQVEDILEIIRQRCKVEDEALLRQKLYTKLYGKSNVEVKGGALLLTEMLGLKRIRVGVPVRDKKDAVRQAGKLLVDDGLAEPKYIDAMLQLMEDLGNYVVIAPGVAMPHARSEAGAKKTGFAIVVPSEPVVFGHPTNDPVRIILALTATDNKGHLQAMRKLSLLIANEEVFEEVIASKTAEELIGRVAEFEAQIDQK